MNTIVFTSLSVDDTIKFAADFTKNLVGGETILLDGDLGAGKTHFVKGLAQGLGIEDVITSPTFALHNSYQGRLTLNHFDFYRGDDPAEAEMLGLTEFFGAADGVCAIEWSQNVAPLLPSNCICVNIARIGENERKITITTK